MATFIEDFYCGNLLKNYGAAKNCHHKQVNVYTTKPPVIQRLFALITRGLNVCFMLLRLFKG